MSPRRIDRNPISVYQRKAKAARRAGENSRCTCGEQNPAVLIAGSRPKVCFECKSRGDGKNTTEEHHVAGRANSSITISIPLNIHRLLSIDQCDWPQDVLRNPDGSPLLMAAGCILGFIDLTNALLPRIGDSLELEASRNSEKTLLVSAAGWIRTLVDLIDSLLPWIIDLLQWLDAYLNDRFGPKWWLDTGLEKTVPKGWTHAKR
jgi:hypothetical protein